MSDALPLKMSDDEFKAKLELTKAFNETAKGYVQISSAALALPLLFTQAIFGKTKADAGILGAGSGILIASWICFGTSIFFGTTYQWLSVRRLWDQFHQANRTLQNALLPGFRITRWVPRFDRLNLSLIWMGMTLGLYAGAVLFTIYAWRIIEGR